ncbi:MAG: hypothetical protein ACJ8FM_15295 [Xanthobacteraceae bacterium]
MIMLARRLVAFVKVLVAGAGAMTALSMGAIVSLQVAFWLATRTWSPFPVAQIFELSQINVPRRYLTASVDAQTSGRVDPQSIIEWLLDLPAIVALFVALAFLALFYASLTSLEKWLPGSRTANS